MRERERELEVRPESNMSLVRKRERERQTDRQTDRQTETERDTETERQRYRERDRERLSDCLELRERGVSNFSITTLLFFRSA